MAGEKRKLMEESNREEETILDEDFTGELSQLYLKCAITPCVCLKGIIEKRIELLKTEEEINKLREKAQTAETKVKENERRRLAEEKIPHKPEPNPPETTKPKGEVRRDTTLTRESQARGEEQCSGQQGPGYLYYTNGECVRVCVCVYVTNFFCRF